MKNLKVRLLAVLIGYFMLFIVSCAGSAVVKTKPIMQIDDSKALVTFFEPYYLPMKDQEAYPFELWDQEKFIGILMPRTYIQYKAEPGEHLFLSRGNQWTYLKATLSPGKRYYVIGKVLIGIDKYRITLDPINKEDSVLQFDIDKWIKDQTAVTVSEKTAKAYTNKHLPDVKAAIEAYKKKGIRYTVLKACDFR